MVHQHGKDLMIKFTINIQDILERKNDRYPDKLQKYVWHEFPENGKKENDICEEKKILT